MRSENALSWAAGIFFLCVVVVAGWITLRWPVLGDASLMHYAVFLMKSGAAPYRQVVDVNLPGTYGYEWMTIALGGYGSLAWRIFDMVCVLVTAAGMTVLVWPVQRWAGLFGGAMYLALHAADGIAEGGQRDLVMTALLMVAAAGVSRFMRDERRGWLWAGALAGGYALTIKPTALLFLLAFGLVLWRYRRERRAGFAVPLLLLLLPGVVVLGWLWSRGALPAFAWTMLRLIPFHNSLGRVGTKAIVLHLLPSSLLLLTLVTVVAAWLCLRGQKKMEREWELLLAGVGCGLLSLAAQGKMLPYHRYPSEGFLLCLVAYVMGLCLRGGARRFRIAFAVLLLLSMVTTARALMKARRYAATADDMAGLLTRDLRAYGPELQGQVQCVDYTAGCVRALEEMQVVQSTGYLYDCYVFQDPGREFVQEYRRGFAAALTRELPRVLVVTNQDCYRPNSFAKIDRWPELRTLIEERYRLVKEVQPVAPVRWASNVETDHAYRLYELKR